MTIVDYDTKKHSFAVLNDTYDLINIPYLLLDKDNNDIFFNEKPEDYGFKIFYKKNFTENQIYQVIEKEINQRIGWLFPISSIISTSHDYARNHHYCRYAYIAHILLIQNVISEADISVEEFNNIINIQFTEKDAIIFVYDKELIKQISEFKIENYYATFYQYGYYLENNYLNPNILDSANGEKFQIQSISKNLIDNEFIINFFNQLCFEPHPIVKFHILYQTIELLIEDILINSLEETILLFKNKKIYTRSLRDRISKVESEKDRINLMITLCKISHDDYKILHENCMDFLKSKGRENVAFPESLYAFRNFIVHDFRYLTKDQSTIMDINYWFELFILDLIINYKNK